MPAGTADAAGRSMPEGSAAGHASGAFPQHARHVNVQSYNGVRKPVVYKEWKKDIRITALAYKVPADQMASLVYLALKGDAKTLVSQQVEFEDLQEAKGLETIF